MRLAVLRKQVVRPLCLVLGGVLVALVLTAHLAGVALYPFAPPPPRLHTLSSDTLRTLAGQAVNNTLVVVPVNTGMLHLADNLLCSLQRTDFNGSNILFWALDAHARTILDKRGHTTYFDPHFFGVEINTNHHRNTENYHRMMLERPKFFIDILSAGYDILMIDVDTIWYQSPLLLRDDTVDAVYSTDAREFYQAHDAFDDPKAKGNKMPPVCAGVFWLKSNEKTVRLYQDMLAVFNGGLRTWFWRLTSFKDDQRGLDCLLNDGRARLVEPLPNGITTSMLDGRYRDQADLRVRLLDQTQVVNGQLILFRPDAYQENLARLRNEGKDRIAVHLNWDPTKEEKRRGAQGLGIWQLDEAGNCKMP
ncbi:glycosyltransferase family 77 protein [Myriangium duriaei CBS 260.36]|uniref:Glycosyltransferase family 77 protein n=1 Tax=Myriangium duriaei CBS 260.36 TaxID=1168546 RepID=A0A9P4IZL6_9PEZI|nr:glycosyltransferase family 77 protein [Myriangium duriaei CBS 260.36]